MKSSPYDINQSRNEEENEGTPRLFFYDYYLYKGTEELCRVDDVDKPPFALCPFALLEVQTTFSLFFLFFFCR